VKHVSSPWANWGVHFAQESVSCWNLEKVAWCRRRDPTSYLFDLSLVVRGGCAGLQRNQPTSWFNGPFRRGHLISGLCAAARRSDDYNQTSTVGFAHRRISCRVWLPCSRLIAGTHCSYQIHFRKRLRCRESREPRLLHKSAPLDPYHSVQSKKPCKSSKRRPWKSVNSSHRWRVRLDFRSLYGRQWSS